MTALLLASVFTKNKWIHLTVVVYDKRSCPALCSDALILIGSWVSFHIENIRFGLSHVEMLLALLFSHKFLVLQDFVNRTYFLT